MMWNQHADAFLTLLHGAPPWPFVQHSVDQRVVWANSPRGMNFVFVHKNRGICPAPGFTSLNADVRGVLPPFPFPPTAVFTMPDRYAVLWALEEPAWPSSAFYRRQQMLNTLLGTPDHAGLARLLPLPGNNEFSCQMTRFDQNARYRLDDFRL